MLNIDSRILCSFYRCTIESILTGCIPALNHKALQRVVKAAQHITRMELPSMEDLYSPKKPHPGELNDFRLVTLMSHMMKTMEWLLLYHLRPQTHHALDPLQFAYWQKTGVEDAIIFLLHRSLSHLDRGSGAVGITFLDLSSAFNTIQPLLLRDKLTVMGVGSHLGAWITDYLTDLSMLGWGTYKSELCHVQKFAATDDTAIVGCIRSGQEDEYRELIQDFVTWCDSNHLLLNTTKDQGDGGGL
ncbi:hypothetical protein L3Q82_007831 [Scortum barcoo]|uniref:Uncharacterized protein n=1 Tax=Scortum barcoo TaxID=214431 RepID=A0ACB8WKQ0_9TELE|nr:hypothetical protein L3Q82_007831 [Scortum barcoo]